MSLPPGFIDELRTRVSLSQVVGRKVTWDMRKSNMAKGDWWAPCPFHQEKSASFHVDDRKGFYYCFGCHAKGDAVTFVKEADNVSFMEAVEILAREAGMQMPARDPKAAEKADRRTQLAAVMEEAVKWFRLQLKTSAAAEARAYLEKRRMSPAAQDRWEIGFAPDQRQGLFNALTQKGIAADLIVEAGLCAKPDADPSARDARGGGAPYDRFRGRIIFPIRDARGRAISLGGRAMDPNARAKYLNGPETDLFDKGRNLYNHGPAREAAGKGQPLIVAEGYMDVIALSEAGFAATVAPMPSTRSSLLGSATAPVEEMLREAVILATLVAHPGLIHRFETALETLDCTGEGHGLIRDLLLTHADASDPRAAIAAAAPAPLDALLSHPHVRNAPAILNLTDTEKAEFALAQDFFILQAERGRRREIEEAALDIEGVVDEGLTWRIAKANEARAEAHRGPQDKTGDAVISPNGVALDKEELAEARKVFDSIRFERPNRRH